MGPMGRSLDAKPEVEMSQLDDVAEAFETGCQVSLWFRV